MEKKYKPAGSLEVICGPMFSGKSEELIRRLRRAHIAKLSVAVFKHALDSERSCHEHVVSHDGNKIRAYAINDLNHLMTYAQQEDISVVGIDEVQFFPHDIITIISTLIAYGKRVIVGGLDLDFRGIPFGPMPILLAIADKITKLRAICTECGTDAHFTQRLVDGRPAKHNDPIILIGASEAYQARCRSCYQIDQLPVW